ncbi:nuclear transport factor 2 family protein [Algoriphagus terrigena]|uniref:nuclear transport factor 2 family protein n=1 Tax=Algoriphagus terrigena TaxID=344884 RepID=UPI0004262018|nr:nuclear transport factor 2 family protein [Algoriphagus terrigena]
MTKKHPNIQLVERFFRAYADSDFDGMNQVMDADIKWHIPGNHPYSGTKNGIRELTEYFEKLNEFGFKAEQIAMGVNDNYVIDCHRNWSTSNAPTALDAMSCLLWKIEDNKIVEVFNFPQNQNQVDNFFNNA